MNPQPSPVVSEQPEGLTPAPAVKRPFPKVLSGAVILLGLAALKLKAVILLLAERGRTLWVNPFEGFGAAQYAIAGGSMVVTVAAYALKYPNRLGLIVGFVAITLIHEVGHAIVIRAKGLRTGYMVFIPFIGGAVTLKDQPRSVFDDAQIGLAGPVAGTIASLAFLQVYNWTRDPLYLLIALAGFVLNLINLLPIGMLDGGRISAGVTKWMWVLGGAFLAYKVIRQPNPLMLLILLLAAFQVYASIAREKEDRFYEITFRQRALVAIAYFSLIIILGHQTFLAMDKLDALAR